jgi:hypothetical protein
LGHDRWQHVDLTANDEAALWNEKTLRSDTLLSSGHFTSVFFSSKAHKKVSQIDILPFD